MLGGLVSQWFFLACFTFSCTLPPTFGMAAGKDQAKSSVSPFLRFQALGEPPLTF